jgi:hypothetical protein
MLDETNGRHTLTPEDAIEVGCAGDDDLEPVIGNRPLDLIHKWLLPGEEFVYVAHFLDGPHDASASAVPLRQSGRRVTWKCGPLV